VLQIMHPWLQSEPGQKETQLVDEQCRIHPWISNLFANIMVTHGLQNLEMKGYIWKLWNISWSNKSNMQQLTDTKKCVHAISWTPDNSTVTFFQNLVLKYSDYSVILM
jgi:hypothetical protein